MSLQNQLDRLEKKVWKESTANFVWLMILSNILFWIFIGFIELKHDSNSIQVGMQHQKNISDVNAKPNLDIK